MINETRKHPHYYKIEYTYSILTSKLSHTKTQENGTITKYNLNSTKTTTHTNPIRRQNIRIESTRIYPINKTNIDIFASRHCVILLMDRD